jgi:HSP20 family protein
MTSQGPRLPPRGRQEGGEPASKKRRERCRCCPIRLTRFPAFSRLSTHFARAAGSRPVQAAGAYPPLNVFRKGDDFVVIAEVPGVTKSDLEVQVKGSTIRLSGAKSVSYSEKAAVHRRERLGGEFDRAVTLPVEIDPDGVKAEYRDGILALFLPRAERDKPKSIKVA